MKTFHVSISLGVIYNQPKTPKLQLGQACDYFVNDVFAKLMFHITNGLFMQAAAKPKQSDEQREFISNQMLSRAQELFWKGQSKCLEYQLIHDSKPLANKTEILLHLDLFNDRSLQNGSLNGYNEASSSCDDCCKTDTNNHPLAFDHRNGSIQGAGIDLQAMDAKMAYLDAELHLMKIQLSQSTPMEAVGSQVEILSREQHQIASRLQFLEHIMAEMQSPQKLNERFFSDLEAGITDNFGRLEEHLILIQGQMETKMSKTGVEAALKVIESRLTAFESQLHLSQIPMQFHPPTSKSNLEIYVYCLELAKRVTKKRLTEYFNSDQNMIYFIFITCVDNNFF